MDKKIKYVRTEAMRAKELVENFAASEWPNPPTTLTIIYSAERPEGGYYRDSRPLKEKGWYHFFIVGTYLGVGGSPLVCANPETGEILGLGFVGE